MPFNIVPTSLTSAKVAAFDFRGNVGGSITDQSGTYTLTATGTPTAWKPGLIGKGVSYAQTSGQYHSTTHADIRRSGSALTWAIGLWHGNDFAVTSNIWVAPLRLLQTAGSLSGNDLRLSATRTSGGSNQWALQGQIGTYTAAMVDNFTVPVIVFVTSNGTNAATFTALDWNTGEVTHSASGAGTVAGIGEVRFGQVSTSSTYNGSITRIDHAVLYNKVLSSTEMTRHWLHLRRQADYLRGFRAGRQAS